MFEWHEEPIDRQHDREAFDCGVAELNLYLRRYARQNHVGGGAKTFVAVRSDEPARILGYYSIGPGELDANRAPAVVARGRGGYPLPVYRLARLAVDHTEQGRGLGQALLLSAGARALAAASVAGGLALVIDAIDERAAQWYQRAGAYTTPYEPLLLVIPLEVIARAIEQAREA